MIMNLASSADLGMKHKPWADGEKRINKFCFIGKDLNKEEMTADLRKCIAGGSGIAPEAGAVPTTKLTYAVGDQVLVKVENDWVPGKVSSLWYREELWETGRYDPYVVELEGGSSAKHVVKRDSDVFIKSAK